MKINFNNRKFIFSIRTIGCIILSLLAIDIIFFKHQYITQTFLGNGVSAAAAVIMAQYKIDYSKKTVKERLLTMLLILGLILILYCFW